jgi:ABC-2 type transport system ATP-binding protein
VEKGEVLGFLGPNGAGKSTTMRMITGFLPPTAGTASICGHDILEEPVEAKPPRLPAGECAELRAMRVPEFLDFVADVHGYRGQRARAGAWRTPIARATSKACATA